MRHQHIIIIDVILSKMDEMLDISVCNVKMCGLFISIEPNEGQKLEGNASNLSVMLSIISLSFEAETDVIMCPSQA